MIKIKAADHTDIEGLQFICKQTFAETFANDSFTESFINDTHKYIEFNFTKEKLINQLSNKHSQFYLCYHDTQLAGYLKINTNKAQTEDLLPDALEIERIYILNQFHGKRIGQTLMKQAYEIAEQKSINEIWLGVWEHNHQAIGFYKKQGFTVFDKHIFTVGNDDQTDLLFKKTL